MREVTPKELRELNEKSWKETQNFFRRRLREIATDGENKAGYKVDGYCFGERIQPWLESLGFKVKQVNLLWYEVSWSEEEDICKKLRRECASILNSTLPEAARNAIDGLKVKQEELGTWTFDSQAYDYVCSECGKHLGYTTPYCPICGKKLNPIKGTTYDKE